MYIYIYALTQRQITATHIHASITTVHIYTSMMIPTIYAHAQIYTNTETDHRQTLHMSMHIIYKCTDNICCDITYVVTQHNDDCTPPV